MRTINRLLAGVSGGDPDGGLTPTPRGSGYWPAAVGLFAFVWFELVYPHVDRARAGAAVVRGRTSAVMLIGGAVFGDRFYERADPFEVYSSCVAKLSLWGRARRAPRRPQPAGEPGHHAGRGPDWSAVVAVLFGSTAFDSFKDSRRWVQRSSQGSGDVAVPAQQPRAAGLLPRPSG